MQMDFDDPFVMFETEVRSASGTTVVFRGERPGDLRHEMELMIDALQKACHRMTVRKTGLPYVFVDGQQVIGAVK